MRYWSATEVVVVIVL
jgi:hypothetical protein